jgi:glycolate oxidase iron-sulfur subunit
MNILSLWIPIIESSLPLSRKEWEITTKAPKRLLRVIVTFQDSCHLRNGMKVVDAPRRLLKAIDGVTYRELKEAEVCCRSAGIYNLLQEEMATSLIDRKMGHVKEITPGVIVIANPGCLLQMKFGLNRKG